MHFRNQNNKRILCLTASELRTTAATMAQVILDPEKYGYKPCDKCNGYGNSLLVEGEKCTFCNGFGVVPKADPHTEHRHKKPTIRFKKTTTGYQIWTEGVHTGFAPESRYTSADEAEAYRIIETLWEMGTFEQVIGEDGIFHTPPKDITAPFKDKAYMDARREFLNIHRPEMKYVSQERRQKFEDRKEVETPPQPEKPKVDVRRLLDKMKPKPPRSGF